mmetsp:Transcript_162704/g.516949  ORF Transcript_162704/g.516949 Transcript_162704/m.516949 type:complete len:365 (-) Transcript_162704:3-1097(-)
MSHGAGLFLFASAGNETWRNSMLIAARHSEPNFAAVDSHFISLFVLGKLPAGADPLVSAAGIFSGTFRISLLSLSSSWCNRMARSVRNVASISPTKRANRANEVDSVRSSKVALPCGARQAVELPQNSFGWPSPRELVQSGPARTRGTPPKAPPPIIFFCIVSTTARRSASSPRRLATSESCARGVSASSPSSHTRPGAKFGLSAQESGEKDRWRTTWQPTGAGSAKHSPTCGSKDGICQALAKMFARRLTLEANSPALWTVCVHECMSWCTSLEPARGVSGFSTVLRGEARRSSPCCSPRAATSRRQHETAASAAMRRVALLAKDPFNKAILMSDPLVTPPSMPSEPQGNGIGSLTCVLIHSD